MSRQGGRGLWLGGRGFVQGRPGDHIGMALRSPMTSLCRVGDAQHLLRSTSLPSHAQGLAETEALGTAGSTSSALCRHRASLHARGAVHGGSV